MQTPDRPPVLNFPIFFQLFRTFFGAGVVRTLGEGGYCGGMELQQLKML